MRKLLLIFLIIISVSNLLAIKKVIGDHSQNGMFGYSTAMNDDWAAIGARDWTNSSSDQCGAVFMFKRNSDEWTTDWLRAQLIEAPSGIDHGHFGHDIAMDGNYMIVGSNFSDEANIFTLVGNNWSHTTSLQNQDVDNFFGRSVSISGDIAVVGANSEIAGSNTGIAYVYSRNQGGDNNWGLVKTLIPSDASSNHYFGTAVAIEGNNIIIGAYGINQVYAFSKDEGGIDNWGETQILTGTGIGAGDAFGFGVSIDGNWAAVTAKDNQSVHVFLLHENNWTEQTTLFPGDARSVELDMPHLIVGGYKSVTNNHAYLYKRDNNGIWSLEEDIVPIDLDPVEDFSSDVAISGNQYLVSDNQSDELTWKNGTEGAAYFFPTEQDYDEKPWGQFTIINFEAGDQLADFMYSEDGWPYYSGVWQTKVHAYETLQWGTSNDVGRKQTEARLNRSGSDLLDGLNSELIEFQMGGFALSSFHKINTEDLGLSWDNEDTIGAGDNRYYTGGDGLIKYNNVTKLQWENMVFNFTVPYPFEQSLGTNRVGTGGAITGYGQATLVVENCDQAWLAEFDPDGSGQIRFDLESFSLVHQGDYGYYTAEVTLNPVDFIQTYAEQEAGVEGNDLDLPMNFEDEGIEFVFDSINFGEGDGNDVIVNYIEQTPEADELPGLFIGEHYWHFGTTFFNFSTSVDFNLDYIPNIQNNNGVRIYRRATENDEWQRWTDVEFVGGNIIRALNVDTFSDWMVASEENQTLPVELSTFSAIQTSSDLAQLNWTTQSETNVLGFNIFRNISEEINQASQINNTYIYGTNTSIESNYSYTDEEVEMDTKYFYWLQSVDLDGTSEIFGPVSLELKSDDETPELIETETILFKAYPNPFNLNNSSRNNGITIKFNVKENDTATVKIYNSRGQLIRDFKNYGSGKHQINWNGKSKNGKKVGSGVYFYRLQSETINKTHKLILIK